MCLLLGVKTNKPKERRCSGCGGKLQFVAVEEDGNTSWICTRCGDEWDGETLGIFIE